MAVPLHQEITKKLTGTSGQQRLPSHAEIASRLEPQKPRGIIRTIGERALPVAKEAVSGFLEREKIRRESQTLGERAVTELVERPFKILKAVSVDLPRMILGSASALGKTVLQGAYTSPLSPFTAAAKKAGINVSTKGDKKLEEAFFKFETESWQDIKKKVDDFTSTSPLATDWEKKNLGLYLSVAGFAADAFTGPGKGKLTSLAVKELIEATTEDVAIRTMIKHGLPRELAEAAASQVSKATTKESVETAIRGEAARLARTTAEKAKQRPLNLPEKPEIGPKVELVRTPMVQKPQKVAKEFAPEMEDTNVTIQKIFKIGQLPIKPEITVDEPAVRQAIKKALIEVEEASAGMIDLNTKTDKYGNYWFHVDEEAQEVTLATPKNTKVGDTLWSGEHEADALAYANEGFSGAHIVTNIDNSFASIARQDKLNNAAGTLAERLKGQEPIVVQVKRDPSPTPPKQSELPSPEAKKSADTIGEGGKAPADIKDTSETIKDKISKSSVEGRVNRKLEKQVSEAQSFEEFFLKSGVTRESLDATARNKGYADALDFYNKNKSIQAEDDSLKLLAQQEAGSEYALRRSMNEEEQIVSNLQAIFADLKGVSLEDLKMKFSEEEISNRELEYQFVMDSLVDDPARALVKYMSKTTGKLPEVTGKPTRKSLTGSNKEVPNSEFGRRGDQIVTEIGFATPEDAQVALTKYLERKERAVDWFNKVKEVRKNIRLSKQAGTFVEKEKNRLAREAAQNIAGLKALVDAAEKAGFRRGLSAGSGKYKELIQRLKSRRSKISAIKHVFNLTDAEMKKVRGPKDPRFMNDDEFATYLAGIHDRAELQNKRNNERLLVEAIIQERDLKKVENLQRALEFPSLKDMSLEQLIEYGDILSKTKPGDTFLGPRMIQTAVNSDLGNIKTIGEGIEAVAKQTGMPFESPVTGKKTDQWLRDATLVERDPLHKAFITEWVAKEADVLTRGHQLKAKINKLAKAARKGHKPKTLRGKFFKKLAPQDEMVIRYVQSEPQYLDELAKHMTGAEIKYAKFLRGFFKKYYDLVQKDAANRWTLRGVKHSRFKDMYFPHMTRSFFERWREDGFMRAMKVLWDKNLEFSRVAIDYNAFGDRGEVLGYEKWFKNNMKREGEGPFTQNSARVANAYFHAFEKKLVLDAMTPKIKLLEFLMGKRFKTPKSITNPEGTEQVHSQLRKHINEWINNKKGQRIRMIYDQGDRAEAVVDASRTFIAIQHLGANIIAQVISGIGGEVATFAGAGIKGWAKGHARALTKQGGKLGKKNSGVIGETPWFELADAANDIGDTLRGGLFAIFGDLSYRARRQFFLGSLTDEEFKTGVIAPKRLAEIKLEMGKWHPLPEFRSIAGSTSAVKAAAMYTEWATPVLQNVYFNLLPKFLKQLRADPTGAVMSKESQALFRAVIGSAGMAAVAYMVLNPDENDRSTLGYARRKAAQEIGTIVQSVFLFGIPTPFGILVGYVEQLREALGLLVSRERYKTAGPGYQEGDLKWPGAFKRALVPRGIQQWMGEPETPIKTLEEVKKETLEKIESGEISVSAAKEYFKKETKSIEIKQKNRRFEMNRNEYSADLLARIESKEISVSAAKKEFAEYIKVWKDLAPESFESSSDVDFIGKISISAKALGTDPVTLFQAIFTGEEIRRMDNGAIILHRGKTDDPEGQREFSIKKREEFGANKNLILDHTVPLQLGGDNSNKNLRLVPKEEWERFTPVENLLGRALRDGDIEEKKARQLIKDFKNGKITSSEVYKEVDDLTRY